MALYLQRSLKRRNDSMSENKKISFEDKMNRLEEIVSKIDSGSLSLEENLALYSEGTKLIKELEKTLTDAKEKINKATKVDN